MKTLESAVSTLSNSEKLSALRDGQLGATDALALVRASLADERLVHEWRGLCAVSDALSVQQGMQHSAPLTIQSIAATPSVALPDIRVQEAANDGVFRWKMVAGMAGFAAVGSLVWGLLGQTAPATQGGPALAQAPAATQPATQSPIQAVSTTAPAGATNATGLVAVQSSPEAPVMIRDPRLDELLAAHKQFGNASALQRPAGSLRSASLPTPRQ
jgi:sigma-E factor negative regulatory protein RseA